MMSNVPLGAYWQFYARRLGPWGWAGLLLLLGASLWGSAAIRNAQVQQERIGRQMAAAKLPPQKLGSHADLGKEEQLGMFYQAFPKQDAFPEVLQGIYKSAAASGLVLETGEYAMSRSEADRLVRYRVALPVKGPFVKVLGFMDKVLQQSPGIAVESVGFKRDKVDDVAVDAKIVFLVFVDAEQ